MPPKKKRKGDFSQEEWKVQRGRRYRKKKDVEGRLEEHKGAGYSQLTKENVLFEKYYQGQGFISEEEWPVFLSTLRESLPATFRITGTRGMADQVLECLKKRFFADLAGLEVEGEKVPAPFSMQWYPDNLAWNVALTKKFIRKSPLVSKFHTFLVRQSEQGNISRQEAVSMIPPLLLDVRPQHKVLDMCAAPGSKTAQLIEMLHAEDSVTSPMPGGVVIANDADNKRCYMLVHQAKRLNSPCFMVTNHDASVFPMLYYHDETDKRHPVYYDRILCDVPCSGDGTLRKNLTIWKTWNPLLGPALHKLQLRILNRGLELLCPGGRLVYSTCSLNPVENEAVISAAIQLSKGAVRLVDDRKCLNGLKTLPGRTSWKLMTKEGAWLESYEDIPEPLLKHYSPSMFPPKAASDFSLEKCVRVLPHHQDTGGFFIAILEKQDWLPWQNKARASSAKAVAQAATESVTTSAETTAETQSSSCTMTSSSVGDEGGTCGQEDARAGGTGAEDVAGGDHVVGTGSDADKNIMEVKEQEPVNGKEESLVAAPPEDAARPSAKILGKPDFKRKGGRGFKEDPYVFFEKDTSFFDDIKPYYGLPQDFPLYQMLTRTRTGKKKNIYFCSNTVRELTLRNDHTVKIINIGVKVMSRCESTSSCSFRLCQEGVDSMVSYIRNHRVSVEREDLLLLLKEPNPLVTSLTPQTQDRLQTLGLGPVLFAYIPSTASQDLEVVPNDSKHANDGSIIPLTCPLYLSGWLAARSARLFLDKSYRYNLLSILGEDPPINIDLESMNTARRKALQAQQEVGVASEDVEDMQEETDLSCIGNEEKSSGTCDQDSPDDSAEIGQSDKMEVDAVQTDDLPTLTDCRSDIASVGDTESALVADTESNRTKEVAEQ